MIAITLIISIKNRQTFSLVGGTTKIMKIVFMIEIIVKVQELQYKRDMNNQGEEKEKKRRQ